MANLKSLDKKNFILLFLQNWAVLLINLTSHWLCLLLHIKHISLVKFLDIRSINLFKCIINLVYLKDKWEIKGDVFINCTLQCVISLEDLNFKLKIPIKRYLSSNLNLQSYEIINYENINCDIDPLTENIDLGDIVSEEIYLALPKYPKKSGVKLKNILITEENSELNPFKILENLKIWNFVLL